MSDKTDTNREFLVQAAELVALTEEFLVRTEEWPALMVALTEEFPVQTEEWPALIVALTEQLVALTEEFLVYRLRVAGTRWWH